MVWFGAGSLYYDPLLRLDLIYNTSGVSTMIDYDGSNLATEYSATTATMLRRYVHGPGVDEPIVWYEGAGTSDRRFLAADEGGSIVSVTDSAGALLGLNTYDEYGIPASGNLGRFQYTGQAWLPELGMYYYKARMYSPTLGRFMQTDPIGYADGMNWYDYVGGDPINFTDPTGLAEDDCTKDGPHCDIVNGIRERNGYCEENPNVGFCNRDGGGFEFYSRSPGGGGGGGGGEPGKERNCTTSVNGKPSPRDAARSTGAAVVSRSLRGALAGTPAGPGGAALGALTGYASVAAQRAYQLYPGNSWDPRNAAAGNRIYGAVTSALGLPRDLSLRMSGLIEQLGRNSNSLYDPANGTFSDRSGNLGNSDAAIQNIDEGRACAQ